MNCSIYYKQWTEAEWLGTVVETNKAISNGWCEIPKGTKLIVTRKFDGFGLKSFPCKCCGVVMRISRVPARDLELTNDPKVKPQ